MSFVHQLHRVLIVDRQLLFRRGLRTLFNSTDDLAIAGEDSELGPALDAARSAGQLSAILVHAALVEDLSELALSEFRSLQALAPVLLLADRERPELFDLIMRTGALGYLLKTSSPAQIIAAVRHACQGDAKENEDMAKTAAGLRALATSSETYSRAAAVTLTAREQDILRLLAQGYTVRESAAELALSMKTVDAHKLNLMRKLDIHNRASLIEYAAANGVIPAAVA